MKRLLLMLMICLLPLQVGAELLAYRGFTADRDAEVIDLGDVTVKSAEGFIEYLRQFPNLKQADLYATPLSPETIDALTEAFPQVTFGMTMRIGDHLVRTDATAFSTLHGNSSRHHDEDDFRYLKYCTNLLALDIGHNSVRDVSFLYDLPDLKVLILACNEITDITPVGSLHQLEYLELFKNDIRDLSCLEACTKLIDLNVCFNHIEDLAPIAKLPRLQRLWVYNSNNWSDQYPVDKQVVADLRTALPNCHVDSTSYSTLGGWREHDRYYVIFHMFKYGEYIPFSRGQEIKQKYPDGINLN